ncbi:MAG: sugar ABC transporter permease, partial [Chloroflexi bacterium]|nr:sugar ABC transporter permease [Chloroflexota bacterium]
MRRLTRDRILSIALITPSAVAILVFVYGFIGFTGFASLTHWDTLFPDYTFVGLRNYAKLFTIERFQLDLRNTVPFTVFFLLACL